jgi:hypothetical protein
MMPVDVEQEQMWMLPTTGSKAIDEMIYRLTVLRAKMLPSPLKKSKRN